MKIKKTLLSIMACVLSLVFVFAFTACGDKDKDKDPVPTGITLDSATLEIATGDKGKLTPTITYSDGKTAANDAALEWSSSAESVATVNKSGSVTAKTAGAATITAKIGEYSATCAVTVYDLRVELSETTASIEKGATKDLTASVKKDGTVLSDEKIEWSSDNTNVATVDDNGQVTAWVEGTANITAKREKGNQSATCAVTVTWSSKPESYAAIPFGEQNKLNLNEWAYWNAQEGWGQGKATAYEAYTEDYEAGKTPAEGYQYIGVEKATFSYEVTEEFRAHTYQVFLRSSDNVDGGLLKYNHVYEVKLKIDSNVAGTILVNPYDDVRARNTDETQEEYDAYLKGLIEEGKISDHEVELVAGTNEITVKFRHDDCGYVYKEGIYDNMGSAVHLQLANLKGRVQLSVYDVQYKDLGAAEYPVEDDETKHDGYVDPNAVEHPAEPEVKPKSAVTVTEVTLTAEDDKAIYNLAGKVDLAQFDNSVDTAKTWLTATYFDLQNLDDGWTANAFKREGVTVEADGTFLIKYDITYLAAKNYAYTSHFTTKEQSEITDPNSTRRDVQLDAEHAVHGASVTVGNKKYSIKNVVGSSAQEDNWGVVSIKVDNVG